MINSVKTTEKAIALTYDDGPNPPYTDNLLDVLGEFQAKATFFTVGERLEKYPKTARRILNEGHELGNHSYSHEKLVNQTLPFVQAEIDKTDAILHRLGVQSNIHFRAPFGIKRIKLPWELARRQKANILWNVDPHDYAADDPKTIADIVVNEAQPGAIVLLHDGGGDRSRTVTATKLVLQTLKKQGYQFKTVSELMELRV